jgi:hypothetical protein
MGVQLRNLWAPLIAGLALAACASAPESKTYSGVYVTAMEVETFYLTGELDPYWVVTERSAREALEAAIPRSIAPGQAARLAVVVEANRSRRGAYGPLGGYEREMVIRRVLSARLVDPAPLDANAVAAEETPAEPALTRRGWRWPWVQRSESEPTPAATPQAPAEAEEESPPDSSPTRRPLLRWPWGRRPS